LDSPQMGERGVSRRLRSLLKHGRAGWVGTKYPRWQGGVGGRKNGMRRNSLTGWGGVVKLKSLLVFLRGFIER
jgi:hypothetical protein